MTGPARPPNERGAGFLPADAFDVRCRACRVPIGDDIARRVSGARRLADGRMELLAHGVVVHRCGDAAE